jgi:hypothetical protein
MRGVLIFTFTVFVGGLANAQNAPQTIEDLTNNPAANSAATSSNQRAPAQRQPQGPTGPTETISGGAPASSPQGDAPPGMQSHPADHKQDVTPKK